MPSFTTFVAAAALALLAGCATYEPKPIDPSRSEAAFRARSLTDPAISEVFERRSLSPPRQGERPLNLDDLSLIALTIHPQLLVARTKLMEVEASEVTAGQSPNPMLSFVPQIQSNNIPNGMPWTLGFTLDVPIETAGKRQKRIDRAAASLAAARWEMADAFWHVRSGVRDALIAHLIAVRQAEAWTAESESLASSTALIKTRLDAGEVSRREADAAEALHSEASLSAVVAEGEARVTRSRLCAALGLPATALDGVQLDGAVLDRRASIMPADEIARVQEAGLLNRLDVQRALADYAFTETDLRLEIARQYPDVHLGPGYQWDTGDHKFYVGIGAELPVFNQNQGPIAEAAARRESAAARFNAVQAAAIGQIEQAMARYAAAMAELVEGDRLVALRERQVRAAEASLAAGQDDRLVVIEAGVALASLRRTRFESLAKLQAAAADLEDALQRPLSDSLDLVSPQPSQDTTATLNTAR